MKASTKAALFSSVVFPGAGYFTLGLKYRGCFCVLITLILLAFLINDAHYKAEILVSRIIDSNNFNIQIGELLTQIQQIQGLYSANEYVAIYSGLGVTWLVSIIDGYRIGKEK